MTVIGASEERDGVFIFKGSIRGMAYKTAASSGSRSLWHRRLDHPSDRVLSLLSHSISMTKSPEIDVVCDTCFSAKQTRDSFSESDNKAAASFDLIYCDVWGPYKTPSSSGAKYFLTIVDDFSRAVLIFLMSEKREVAVIFQNFMAMVDRQFGKGIKII